MNVKFSLALSTALLMTASAFAADPASPNIGATPDKLLSPGSTPAISQTESATTKDAASSTTATQETSTTTTTGATGTSGGTVAGDAQATETTEVKKTEAQGIETQTKSSPAVEATTTGSTTTATTQTTTTTPGQGSNVQKLFHMLQHNNTPQAGATSPETQPATGEKTAQ